MSFNFKVRTLQVINHLFLIIGFYHLFLTNQWHLLGLSYIMYVIFAPIGIACGMHRLLSHRAYKTSKFWERLLSIFSVYATVGSTIAWVAIHRFHHTNAEKPNDTHSPYIGRESKETLKFSYWQAFKSWIGIWNIKNIPPRYVIDLIHDPFHNFLHKNYFVIIILTASVLAAIDPWLMIFVYAIPACMSLHATSVISVVAHIHGYKTHKINDESRNTWIGSLVTLGDGWHNNHHANPGAWTTKEKWWELDPCGWLIKLIKKD